MDKEIRPYKGIYDDLEYCKREVYLARKLFGNKNTTEEQYEGMLKGLGLLSLYCPEEFKSIAQATLYEAVHRKYYFLPLWGYCDE